METIVILIFFAIEVLVTIPITSLLCRYQLSRHKHVSYATVFVGASGMPFLLTILAFCMDADLWSSEPFHYRNAHIEFYVAVLSLIAALSIAPALGVVIYYRRRSKRDETLVG